jgi:hypothetical protein
MFAPPFVLLFLTLFHESYALTMDVAAGSSQCVYFDVEASLLGSGSVIFGSFQVASGGFLDIDLAVKKPNGEAVYTAERKTTDRFSAGVTDQDIGEWSACFSNKMSTLTAKAVSFNFRLGEGYDGDEVHLQGNNKVATRKEIVPIEQNILKLASELIDIRELQNYANVRERAHRDTTESTNDRVKWFSVCEFILLLITNVWQIHTLRQFFEKRARI